MSSRRSSRESGSRRLALLGPPWRAATGFTVRRAPRPLDRLGDLALW
ncbi:hypothetical protein [Sorangium sp. So ce1151]